MKVTIEIDDEELRQILAPQLHSPEPDRVDIENAVAPPSGLAHHVMRVLRHGRPFGQRQANDRVYERRARVYFGRDTFFFHRVRRRSRRIAVRDNETESFVAIPR